MMNSATFRRWRSCDCKAGSRLHSLSVHTAIRMALNGLSRLGTSVIAKVLSIGSKPTFVTARDEMKRFSSARLGVAPLAMIARNYLKLRNWRPRFAEHRNLRLSHHSRRRPASQRYARYGPIGSWIGFGTYCANAVFSLLWPSFLECAPQGRAFQPASPCPPFCKVISPI